MNYEALAARDMTLLRETWQAVADGAQVPRNPAWDDDYDPLAILGDLEAFPEHELIALVNLRIAMHPDENWVKCADCGRIFLADDETPGDTVCSARCWNSYCRYLAADVGVSVSRFNLLDEE